MKSVLSISLGSKSRNHQSILTLGGEEIKLERRGVEGDIKLARQLHQEYDGKVNAFGAGGYALEFHLGDHTYKLRSVQKIIKYVEKTPVVDGNGIKDTIERSVLQSLPDDFDEIRKEASNSLALVTSAVDRYSMAESIEDAGYDMIIGISCLPLG